MRKATIQFRWLISVIQIRLSMSGKQRAQNEQLNIFSNSIIELSVPTASTLPRDISFQWKSLSPSSFLAQNHLLSAGQHPHRYACSPLDHGSIINVTIKNTSTNQIIQTMDYGPVQIQPQLLRQKQTFKPSYEVGIAFNEQFMKKGQLLIKDGWNSVNVEIQIEQNQKLDVQLNKAETNQPLLRVYENQPRSLGIYVYHQYPEFKQIAKRLKVWNQFGYYLKVVFSSRLCRDALIYQLLRKGGLIIDQLESVLTPLSKIKNNLQLTVSVKESANEHPHRDDDESSVHTQVIEDVYNILYNSTQQQQGSEGTASKEQTLEKRITFDKESAKTMKQSSFSSSEGQHYKKKFGSIIFQEPNYGKKLIEISKRKEKKDSNKNTEESSSPSQHLKQLYQHYQRLIKENIKLKKQNLQLKSQNTQPEDNMAQITQIIQVMAKKLSDLQSKQLKAKQSPEPQKYQPAKSKFIPRQNRKEEKAENHSVTKQKITNKNSQALNSTKQKWKPQPRTPCMKTMGSPGKKVSPSPIRQVVLFP